MRAENPITERVVLGVAAIVIGIPGIRLVFDTGGYADGKDNLTASPDLFSDLQALGAIFVAAAVALLAGALVPRLRGGSLLVGVVAFLPQGIARVLSYLANDGQHDSYLRAGVVETILGIALAVFALMRVNQESRRA